MCGTFLTEDDELITGAGIGGAGGASGGDSL